MHNHWFIDEKYRHYDKDVEKNYNHTECGDTKHRMYVKRVAKGWLFNCFNCGQKGFMSDTKELSSVELMALVADIRTYPANYVSAKKSLRLPADITYRTKKWPPQAIAWLQKYGITHEEITDFEIGYSPSMRRVILPVMAWNGEPVYWQGRTVDNPTVKNPKYINARGKRDALFTRYSIDPTYDGMVIVEDILSAIKVGRQVDTTAVLGSFISGEMLTHFSNYDILFIWLDYDKRFHSIKYCLRLSSLLGIDVVPIITEKDPKDYSNAEINDIIDTALDKVKTSSLEEKPLLEYKKA